MQRLLAGAAVLALALAFAGCGGKSARAGVSAYFDRVNHVEQSLAPQISHANIAFRRFRTAAVSPKELRDLKKAERTIVVLHRRLAGLDPPVEARKIHLDLLHLVSLQAAFAKAVVQLATYGPRLNAVLSDVGAAGARLQRGLKTRSAVKQASAFRAYANALEADLGRLGRLTPPGVALPSERAEAARLARTARLSRKIAAALRPLKGKARRNLKKIRARRKELSLLVGQLRSVSSLAERRRVRAEQVKAVLAFNGRLAAIGRLSARIERERIALERKL